MSLALWETRKTGFVATRPNYISGFSMVRVNVFHLAFYRTLSSVIGRVPGHKMSTRELLILENNAWKKISRFVDSIG